MNEIEDIKLEEEIIEIPDYTDDTQKIVRKLMRKIFVIFVISIIILSTGIIDKHDDFDVVLKSALFLSLFFVTFGLSIYIFILIRSGKKMYREESTYKYYKKLLEILDLLSVVPIFMAILTLSNVFFVSPSFIDGASMEPNYYDGDDILFWHLNVEYERFDVVILKSPDGSYWIKRIIGLPGDNIILDNGVVFLNGSAINQDFLIDENGSIDSVTKCRVGDPNYCEFNVPENEYFLLGDNRSVSDDSRTENLGFVKESELYGKVIFKFNNIFRN